MARIWVDIVHYSLRDHALDVFVAFLISKKEKKKVVQCLLSSHSTHTEKRINQSENK